MGNQLSQLLSGLPFFITSILLWPICLSTTKLNSQSYFLLIFHSTLEWLICFYGLLVDWLFSLVLDRFISSLSSRHPTFLPSDFSTSILQYFSCSFLFGGGLFFCLWGGVVVYNEHTNIHCIVVFSGVEGAKPCTSVRASNLPV